jgi:hypothetical protein
MDQMHSIDREALIKLFDCEHSVIAGEKGSAIQDTEIQEKDFENVVDFEGLVHQKKAVLGIDIYQYSQYEERKQIVIPFVFQRLLVRTFNVCLATEPFLFQKYNEKSFENRLTKFLETFIDTGDGGFLILDTPLHAVVFAMYFEAILRNYNSRFIYEKLNRFTDSILLRYAITYGSVYKIESEKERYFNNFYGAAIINCARIISKDRLNRCLIDAPTFDWFLYNTNGIETLICLPLSQLSKSRDFSDYSFPENAGHSPSYCLPEKRTEGSKGIERVDVLKIGEIQAKSQILSVFNLQLQFSYKLPFDSPESGKDVNFFTATLGNLNTQGILKD